MIMFKSFAKSIIRILYLLLFGSVLFSCNSAEKKGSVDQKLLKKLKAGKVLLPNGWSLTSPSNSLPLDELPLNLQVSLTGRLAAVTNNGYGKQSIMLFDVEEEKLLDRIKIHRAWYGLKFSVDEHKLYVSGGNDNQIRIYSIRQNHLVFSDSIVLGDPWPDNIISPAGLELDEKENRLYVVTKEDKALYMVDLVSRKIQKIPLPAEAYTCVLANNKLYISIWGAGKVAVFNTKTNKISGFIKVESHPNDMVLSKDRKYLFVANSNSNSVSVINLDLGKVLETIGTALFPDALAGSTPNGLAISDDGQKLFIANADNNCLAVFDISEPGNSNALGFIPTGWYPTSVKIVKDKILVTNGKGERSMPNSNGPNPYLGLKDSTLYSGRMFKGSLSFIPFPDERELQTYTQVVYENTPYNKKIENFSGGEEGNPIPDSLGDPSPIKYVFYVIKENRTYDQVFGDIERGNGDSTLCLFPRIITPNHHKLVETFTLFDNFYVNAEVSADGHNWSMAAYATDYVEKTWPTLYGGRGGIYDYEGTRQITSPEKGYVWDYCQREGISYRSYGEFIGDNGARLKALEGHFDSDFTGFKLSVMDTIRFHQWKNDFDFLLFKGEVPRFSIIRLPNDHTSGAKLGTPTPRAMVADNDLALGMLVEHISHSSIWNESAIFVLEDDAQNGPDHVDAHRSVLLVISPFTKRSQVDHTLYTTASVLRTMELILGLPPMSQYDAAATPLYRSFVNQKNLTPYEHLPNSYRLDEMNKEHNELTRLSEQFDLTQEDAADDIAFNEVIWKTVKGMDSEMPPPRRGAFIRVLEDEEEE
jgi:YVTN family beta-propeller protein